MSAKDQFLRDKKLSGEWNNIVKGECFEKAMLHVRCALMETGPTREALVGAEHVIHLMEVIAENTEIPFEFPNPGLHHNIDSMPEKPKKE